MSLPNKGEKRKSLSSSPASPSLHSNNKHRQNKPLPGCKSCRLPENRWWLQPWIAEEEEGLERRLLFAVFVNEAPFDGQPQAFSVAVNRCNSKHRGRLVY